MAVRTPTDVLVLAPEGKRLPGRPKGSTNKDRALTIERIKKMADPIAFLACVARRSGSLAILTYFVLIAMPVGFPCFGYVLVPFGFLPAHLVLA